MSLDAPRWKPSPQGKVSNCVAQPKPCDLVLDFHLSILGGVGPIHIFSSEKTLRSHRHVDNFKILEVWR